MHFTNAVTIFIARELASPMVDMLMIISPGLETAITLQRHLTHGL